jgi:hypothetical protein
MHAVAIPTNLELLDAIYGQYRDTFLSYSKASPARSSKVYVPIDVTSIATALKTDAEELFGRLYFHLDHKYRYQQEGGEMVHLFALQIGDDRHCIHFPYLAAILAEHQDDNRRQRWALRLSVISIFVAFASAAAKFLG